LGGRGRRITAQGKDNKTLSQKQTNKQKNQKDWDTAQVVECLPSMHKTLGSILCTEKKEREKKKSLIQDYIC
jgi:hypothetical protein